MINITYKVKSTKYFIEIKGHANTAPFGKDIVCASVSTVSAMLNEALKQSKVQRSVKLEAGYTEFKFNTGCNSELKSIVDLCVGTFKSLAEQYPGNVSFKQLF